ncbi:MAG: DUF4837 family protein [Luteibaculum sp.]
MLFKNGFVPRLILLFSFPLYLVSCGDDVNIKPAYTGASGELVVVCETNTWKQIQDTLGSLLQPNFPMLPQAEAILNLIHYQPNQVNQLIERHRNMFWVDIKPELANAEISIARDAVAKGQLSFYVDAASVDAAINKLSERYGEIIELLRIEERKRYQEWLALHAEREIQDSIADIFGYQTIVPHGSQIVELEKDFSWIKWEREKVLSGTRHFISTGIVMYRYPYTSDSAFTVVEMEKNRNQILSRIPGPKQGSVMTTQKFIDPELKQIESTENSKYRYLFRGLWRTSESFLGGPFVSIAQLDPNGEEIVVTEVFILAPKFSKREFMKEAEAIVYSFAKAD